MIVEADPKNPYRPDMEAFVRDERNLVILATKASNYYVHGRGALLVMQDNNWEVRYLDYSRTIERLRQEGTPLGERGLREEWAREIAAMDPQRTFVIVVVSNEDDLLTMCHYRVTLPPFTTLWDLQKLAANVRGEREAPEPPPPSPLEQSRGLLRRLFGRGDG